MARNNRQQQLGKQHDRRLGANGRSLDDLAAELSDAEHGRRPSLARSPWSSHAIGRVVVSCGLDAAVEAIVDHSDDLGYGVRSEKVPPGIVYVTGARVAKRFDTFYRHVMDDVLGPSAIETADIPLEPGGWNLQLEPTPRWQKPGHRIQLVASLPPQLAIERFYVQTQPDARINAIGPQNARATVHLCTVDSFRTVAALAELEAGLPVPDQLDLSEVKIFDLTPADCA